MDSSLFFASPTSPPTTGAAPPPSALLCLSTEWNAVEQQTLWLAAALHRAGWQVRLVVAPNSALHLQAQAQQVPCYPFEARWPHLNLRAARALAHWLQQEQLSFLLTTYPASLCFAGLVKLWAGPALRLVHRQLEPLPASGIRPWQLWGVAAWLAPLPHQAREVLARTRLDARRLWVVPAILAPTAYDNAQCTPAEIRQLLDLPPASPLLGVVDCGADGPAFAVETLYRLRQEYGSEARLVVVGSPATPPDPARWEALRHQIQQLHLGHCVQLRPLHNAAVPTLFYQALDALLLPAAPNATGTMLLTALASGCPVVCAATADAPDVVQDGRTGRLFPAGDVAAAAVATLATLHHPAAAQRRAVRAAALLRHWCAPGQQSLQLAALLHFLGQPETVA